MWMDDNTLGFFSDKMFLSNFYPCSVPCICYQCRFGKKRKRTIFNSSEQAYMYMKALSCKDIHNMRKIRLAATAGMAKKFGRKLKNFDQMKWDNMKENVMKKVLVSKFKFNPHLCKELLKTRNMRLVECSPYDRYWGIGISINNRNHKNAKKWLGKNKLGELLMEVRKEVHHWRNIKK